MRVFRRVALLGMLAAAMAGCAGPHNRNIIRNQLNPEPMSGQAWAQARGTYMGPVRETTIRGAFEGEASYELRLDLAGSADSPDIILYTDKGFSTAWAEYGERKGLYTNVPAKTYGAQGTVYATTHAPNQVDDPVEAFWICYAHTSGPFMVLTFRENGHIDVDWVDHAGWHGEGELWRVPAVLRQQ